MEMTPQRWAYTSAYISCLFGEQDPLLRDHQERARRAGLPDISVGAEVGRLLHTLVSLCVGGRTPGRDPAPRGVEVGTLGGYSGIWIARALGEHGRLTTIELDPAHADFARLEFDRAGLSERVDVVLGDGCEVLRALRSQLGTDSIDVLFMDADKRSYPEAWAIARDMIRPGGLLLADNALGSTSWWIDDPEGANPYRDAADRLNRTLSGDRAWEATMIPLRQGVLVARRTALASQSIP